eukprot:snap_masked-scaffold_26-processed-gene-3.16-mRNA-1 protein AED:1.00 eAED:1.00 QI:0/0/0/0/1/1/2/0/330
MNKFGLDESLLIAIAADNTNTNKKVCRDLGTQFLGCLSHRSVPSFRAYIKTQTPLSEDLHKIQLLFCRIKKSKKLTAAFTEFTDKVVILPNVTRWSGKFFMMKRYLDIWMFIAQINDDEVKDLLLGQRETRTLEKTYRFSCYLRPLHRCSSKLKFNLGDGKKVVANLLRDVFKVYWEEEDKLDAIETLSRLVKDPSEEKAKTPHGDYVVAELASQKRKSKKNSTFTDVGFIPVTSCSVEGLFSQYKLIFIDKRNRMMSASLNRLVFLKLNKDELMDHKIHFAMKNKIPGFDDKEEEEKEMAEQNDEEEKEDLTLEGVCSCDKEVHSDDEA